MNTPEPHRRAVRALAALAAATLLLLTGGGCAGLCGDQGTREGAWDLVFRCSSQTRP